MAITEQEQLYTNLISRRSQTGLISNNPLRIQPTNNQNLFLLISQQFSELTSITKFTSTT